MKLRFLVAAGSVDALRDAEGESGPIAASGLLKVFTGERLAIWAHPDTPVILGADGRTALVGLLFERSTGRRLSALPDHDDLKSRIVADFWGAYALVLAGEGGHELLRDPSGSVPVYYGSSGRLELYASDADMLGYAWSGPFRPDMEFIRHWLTFPFLRTARTGAAGISELLPGSWRRFGPAGETLAQAWSPFDFAEHDDRIESFADAAVMLREECFRTIPCLAVNGEEVMLQLSGGLDSSIVAACLAGAGVPFRALTFATRASDGDERRFGREVADRFGIELSELVEDMSTPGFELGNVNILRPPPNALLQPLHRAVALWIVQTDTGIILDGAGGDNVFAYLNTASPVVDALRAKGSASALRALRDLADFHGCTMWTAAGFAWRAARRGSTMRWRANNDFLAPGAAVAEPDFHPWLSPSARLPPGKADHIRMIVGIRHFLADPLPGAPAVLHPLLAQPLMELCLRIPTWLWVAGGRDRSVARAAFEGLLPDAILARRGKGRLESMFMKGYMKGRPLLDPFLRDGRLAQHGIVDVDSVSAYLGQSGEPRDGLYVRLLEIAAAEQWLRSFDP